MPFRRPGNGSKGGAGFAKRQSAQMERVGDGMEGKTMNDGNDSVAVLDPIMVGVDDAAALCGVGRTLWYDLVAAGKTPAPRRLGRRVLWLRDELTAWCEAGCPSRERWEATKKGKRR